MASANELQQTLQAQSAEKTAIEARMRELLALTQPSVEERNEYKRLKKRHNELRVQQRRVQTKFKRASALQGPSGCSDNCTGASAQCSVSQPTMAAGLQASWPP